MTPEQFVKAVRAEIDDWDALAETEHPLYAIDVVETIKGFLGRVKA